MAGASDVILHFYKGFLAGDAGVLAATADDGTVWYIDGRSRLAGEYKGTDAILALRARMFDLTGGSLRPMRADTVDVAASGSHAYLMDVLMGERDGRELMSYVVLVAHVEGERLREVHTFWENQHDFDEFFG